MKANYPVEYMTALLTAESGDKDKISAAINECRHMDIKVLQPDINQSKVGFSIEDDKGSKYGKAIRFGLSAIKNVGEAATTSVLESRKDGDFVSFADFISRVDNRKINKRVLESLVKVGAMSNFGNRSSLLKTMDSIRDKVSKNKESENQQGLFAGTELKKTEAAPFIAVADLPEFNDEELEALERQLLGYSLSAKPISEIIGALDAKSTHKIDEILSSEIHIDKVKVAAVVSEIRVITTKKTGAEMAFAKIEDGTGILEIVIFPKIFKETKDFWATGKPLLVAGKVDIRDETPGMIVEAIETLTISGDSQEKNTVQIFIPKGTNINSLKKLKTLLTENLGDTEAVLDFEEGKKVKLPFKIAWSERLAEEINETLESTVS